MTLVVEEDILPNPPAVGLFNPVRVMFHTNLVAQLVEMFFLEVVSFVFFVKIDLYPYF